jgi:ribosomal protein L11 methyltransferase
MAQFIEDLKGQFASFLDVGTGTGILSMVARKQGAKNVVAIDIGELSVKAARQNMRVNGLTARVMQADIKNFRSAKQFDFVAANLVTEDLIEHRASLLDLVKDNGFLAVSGISLENLPRFCRRFKKPPLQCLKISRGREWSGLLFRKS